MIVPEYNPIVFNDDGANDQCYWKQIVETTKIFSRCHTCTNIFETSF